ncbi:MAG: DMT family transporter [Myxococcota bacterium]
MAFAGTTLFSLKAILIKVAYGFGAESFTVLFLRMAFALPIFLVLGAIHLRRHGTGRLSWRTGLASAVLGFLSYYLASTFDFLGLTLISAQLERLILFLYPTFVALLAIAFLQERMRPRMVLALFLSYGGVVLLFGHEVRLSGDGVWVGAGLVLCAALSFAVYATFAKPMVDRLGSILFTVLAMSAASIAVFIHALLRGVSLDAPPSVWGLGAAIAVFSTVLPSFMIAEGIRRLGAIRAGIIGGAGPMVTAVLAVSVLGEPFGLFHLGGIALTTVGMVLLIADRK